MTRIVAAAASFLLTAASAEAEPELPGWMAGCWEQREGDRWTEECWRIPRAGMMIGSSRSGRRENLLEWETLRIERGAPNGEGPALRLAFFASPGGKSWTLFAWSPAKEPGLAFFNAANDYPQRIRYWREGRELMAEIALADGSKARRWRYRRARGWNGSAKQ